MPCYGGQVNTSTIYYNTGSYQNTGSYSQYFLGQRGAEVRALQQMLNNAGFSVGLIDGVYGRKTERAYLAYQAEFPNPSTTLPCSPYYGGPTPVCPPTVTPTYSTPVISGVSGSQSLTVNQAGTWNVNAYSVNGGTLSYSVNWGDQHTYPYLNSSSAGSAYYSQQTATFTHTYLQAGTYTAVFTVTNSLGQSAQTSLTINIVSGINNPSLYITTTTLPSATLGTSYYANISGTGGSGSYTWTITSGTLPLGLTFTNARCFSYPCQTSAIISGTPIVAGSRSFTVSLASGINVTNQTYTINVYGGINPTIAPVIYSLSPISGTIGTQVTIFGIGFNSYSTNTVNFGYGGSLSAYSYNGSSLTFSVPASLSNCSYAGQYCSQAYIPLSPGTYPISVTNSNGTSNTMNFTVVRYPY